MIAKRNTVSYKQNPTLAKIPTERSTAQDESVNEGSESPYYVPTPTSQRRFTRKNNSSVEKSQTNLSKNYTAKNIYDKDI